MTAIAIAVVVVVLAASYLAWLSSRLKRLAARVDAMWTSLDAQLIRRAAAAVALAAYTGDDELRLAARAALVAPVERDAVENALSRALRRTRVAGAGAGADPEAGVLVDLLAGCAARIRLARRFFNDAVRDERALRSRWISRLLRLGSSRQQSAFFEIDDEAEPSSGADLAVDRGAASAPGVQAVTRR
jgi:hypothetical protein